MPLDAERDLLHAADECHRSMRSVIIPRGRLASRRTSPPLTMYRGMDMRFWLEKAEAELNMLR